MIRFPARSAIAFCAGLIFLSVPSGAQTTKVDPSLAKPAVPSKAEPAQQPVGSDPEVTSASYGDWAVRCQKQAMGAETQRFCEVVQTVQIEGRGPVAQIAVGHLKKSDPLRLTVLLPANVAFPSTPKLVIDGKDGTSTDLAWRRCMPTGCVADTILSEEFIRTVKVAASAGHIASLDGANQEFNLQMSFRGLPQALAALAKESW